MVNRKILSWKYIGGLMLLFAGITLTSAQSIEKLTGDASKGQELFQANCTACHALDAKVIGPALGGVVERLQNDEGLGKEWLQKWVTNNEELRAAGDEYANRIFKENNQTVMTNFPQFTAQDVADILEYTTNPPAEPEEEEDMAATAPAESGIPIGVIMVGFAVLASLLAWILIRLNTLVKLMSVDELSPSEEEKITSVGDIFEKYGKIANATLAVLGLLALYGVWQILIGIGVDKGYQPEQPIYFSHKIHNGIQGIDCQYCHSNAKYGKVSGIPSTNVCMNCHYLIKEYKGKYTEEGKDKKFYTGEIQKIYEAVGFDPSTNEYTGEEKPLEWTRIHNLPDFVYFNHSQHVVAGEQAILKAIDKGTIPNYDGLNLTQKDQVCFACHGSVNEMDEVYMANDFTMGWCIECHRSTEVDMENEYNKEYYYQLHEKVKKEYGDEATLTVDAIGGLECGKCHY